MKIICIFRFVFRVKMVLETCYIHLKVLYMSIELSKDLDGFVPNIYYLFNKLWFIQTFLCFCYCLKTKKILPTMRYSKHFIIFQFNIVLFTNAILYLIEITYTNKFILSFDSFLHHFFALCIFLLTFIEQDIISVVYLAPYLVHSLYWSLDTSYDVLLFGYNVSVIITIILIISCRCSTYKSSMKIPFVSICLVQLNLFTYFYDDGLNLNEIEVFQMKKALICSCTVSIPFYLYFVYVYLKRERICLINKGISI